MKAPPSFQFYPADFLSDENVVLMSNEQVGCYIKLLCYCWREGSIPNDMEFIARLCGVANGENMATLWQKKGGISECFQQDGSGRLFNRRLRLEREKQISHHHRQSQSGKKGAHVRWGKDAESQKKNGCAINSPMAKNSSSSSSLKELEYTSNGFDEFYFEYPRKVGKIAALKAWKKIKNPSRLLPTILNAIKAQKKEKAMLKASGKFCPEWKNPSTWLNAGCWDDEPETTSEEQNRNALLMKGISLYGDKAAFAEFSQHHKFSKTELEITAWKYKEKNNE